jgi:hypothetical protein
VRVTGKNIKIGVDIIETEEERIDSVRGECT